jgi:hypothetical protein
MGLSDRRHAAICSCKPGPQDQDQTLFGIGYHQPDKEGSRFDAGAGIRVTLPLDPYVKGRPASLGVGMGFEMLLGTETFLARPVTF